MRRTMGSPFSSSLKRCLMGLHRTEADFQGFYSSEPDFFLVADLNRRIVGFVYGRGSKNVPDAGLRRWRAPKAGSVEVLAVEEQYRGQGIATLILSRLFT